MRRLAWLLTLALVLPAGCKKAVDKLHEDAQLKPDEKPKIVPKSFGVEPSGGGAGGGYGAVQAVRGAVQRVVNEKTLKDLHLMVETASASSDSGNLPSKQQIMQMLQSDRTNPSAQELVGLINDGLIVLTDKRSRESVWAYEAAAAKQGGWVVTSSGLERVTPDQLQQKLRAAN